jgi:malonate transporter
LSAGAGLELAKLRNAGSAVGVATLVKLLVMPVFMWGWTSALGVDGLPQAVAIVSGGVPSAAASYILARKMGGDAAWWRSSSPHRRLLQPSHLPLIITLARRVSGLD